MGAWRNKCYVYTIADPKTKCIFYVGESSYPYLRFMQHMSKGNKTTAGDAIKKIVSYGGFPLFRIVDKCPYGNHQKLEHKWITIFKSIGHKLINKSKYKRKICLEH